MHYTVVYMSAELLKSLPSTGNTVRKYHWAVTASFCPCKLRYIVQISLANCDLYAVTVVSSLG